MTKLNFKYFSKPSLTIRIILSLILIVFVALIIVYKKPISQKIYKWEESPVQAVAKVSFIDVGQGDSTFIELPDGKNMLIDCGAKSASSKIVDFLNEKDVETINYFLITHADADHVGGGVAVFENFEIENFYRPMMYSESEEKIEDYPTHDTIVYDDIIRSAIEENCEMFFTSDATSWSSLDGSYEIKVLYPDAVYSDNNESSAVIKAEINDFKFLFMGDADVKVEEKLIEKYGFDLHVDVLKVGHHGSNTSTSQEFVDAVRPSYAIISVGEDNSYGHPSEDVLQILNDAKVTVLTTIEKQDIEAVVGESALNVASVEGKYVDVAMICVIVGVVILILWGVSDLHKKSAKGKKSKK